jgi:hypothetical protein
MDGPVLVAGVDVRSRVEDVLQIVKAWGFALLMLFGLLVVGTFLYGIHWWCTSSDFREALLQPIRGNPGLSPEAARALAAQRKHKIETATATQLRQIIIAEAPNLVQASNRIPVGSKEELEELRALATVIPNKKSD